jgi:hypothetical protein
MLGNGSRHFSPGPGGYSLTAGHIVTDKTMGPVRLLRAKIFPYGAAQPAYTTETAVGELMVADLDLDPSLALIGPLASLPPSELCEPLLFVPINTDADSLPEPLEECETAVLAGKPLRDILKVVALAGAAAGGTAGALLVGDAFIQGHAEHLDTDDDGRVALPDPGTALLVREFMQRPSNLESEAEAEVIVRNCREYVSKPKAGLGLI